MTFILFSNWMATPPQLNPPGEQPECVVCFVNLLATLTSSIFWGIKFQKIFDIVDAAQQNTTVYYVLSTSTLAGDIASNSQVVLVVWLVTTGPFIVLVAG